ncbi:MAG: penicillin-binding transpeptidase domain-containing protein, partial [Clostridia bacterium]
MRLPTPGMTVRKRLLWLTATITFLFCMVLLRVGQLTIVDAEELTMRGVRQWTRDGIVSAPRGTLYDRNGKTLAQSATAYLLCVNPRQVVNPTGLADLLCPMLGLDRDMLLKRVADTSQSTVILKRQVTRNVVDTLRTLRSQSPYKESRALQGLSFDEDRLRFYPMGNFLTQTLGLTNVDGVGQSGLEQQYNTYLAGQPGRLITEVDAKSRVLADGAQSYLAATPGNDLYLTIDQNVQSFVEKAMRQCIEVNEALRVMAIVMDVNTGAILAMGMKPDFDPNDPPRNDVEAMQRLMRIPVISDVYEPGSTFKVITASAALDLGLTTPTEGFYCSGTVAVDGDRIHCWGNPHGAEDMRHALHNSCNPVFVE